MVAGMVVMTIASVESRQLQMPQDETLRPEDAVPLAEEPRVHLVRVEADDGGSAWGEAWCDDPGEMARALDVLAPVVIGATPLDRGTLWDRMVDRLTSGTDPLPAGAAVLSAIDLALWDLAGRMLDLPVYQMLGGRHRERLEAYASGISRDEPEVAAKKAREMVAAGFHALRIEAGAEPERDLAVIEAVREAVGNQVLLLVDAGQGLAGRDEAMDFGGALDRNEVFWYEEPLPHDDWTDYVSLRHALNTPIAGGKRLRSPGAFLHALMRGALDVLTPDVRLCGGITGLVKIAELARWFGARVSPHNGASQIGLIASTHAALTLQSCVMTQAPAVRDSAEEGMLEQPPSFDDGFVVLPDGPGLGIRVREEFGADQMR